MSRPTVSTGYQILGDNNKEKPVMDFSTDKLKVVILGDFSGRASRRLCEPDTISSRRVYLLNRDTFEGIFADLGVSLQLPVMEQPLALPCFDDLHPDYLYSRLPLFKKFIELEQRLLDPDQFQQAAEEIQQWKPELASQSEGTGRYGEQSILDEILAAGRERHAQESQNTFQVDQLIKDIVAPYVQKSEDPRQGEYLDALAEAASDAMRKVMHHSDFRQLEASWLSFQFLLRRIEEHGNLDLYLVDVSKEELLADFAQAESDLEKSQVFKLLVERETISGNIPYNLVVGDYFISDEERDLHLLIDLSTIAEAAGSALLLGGETKLAGCPNLSGSVDPDDWYYPLSDQFEASWQAVREYSASNHVALAAPRFMLRLPFGKEASTTEYFNFEELTSEQSHEYYLWGNSVYLLALTLCQEFSQSGKLNLPEAARYENLPLHLRKLPHGEWLTPCAEALLTDRAAAKFIRAGISTLRSVQGRDQVVLPKLISLEGGTLKGPWS
ncbi:type VI secretion system contractile sheath large subunit [Microbulbifer sp. OS29]|uniref:Type VI secretion system contractile sheath large subunit n=1 Tax=Microbulbifer okhotskensis TaxID=2926617 RepID=A0A9X2EIN8_9GAMM|nr:type VI secretion system contractile sheath large subunit [Microbulbifer okhotskensis]MCO1332942.1 type VI secretion system contractile sheath large subunit [Microbulbifer okhotskensis]